MTHWLVYTRHGCTLCQEMLEELAEMLGSQAQSVVVRYLDGDPELERKYGQRVPVLLADGEFVCCYRLDRERVRPYLKEADGG